MDNSKTNISVLCFVSLTLLIGVIFVFDDAYGISLNFNIQVSLDQDEYEVGDEPIVTVVDAKKNTASYIKNSITVKIVTRVSSYTVPVTISTIQLVETNTNSGIFTGKVRPISEQDFTHSSGAANKYLSASYTPVFRGQIYSSAYAALVASPPSDSTIKFTPGTNPTDCPKSFDDYNLYSEYYDPQLSGYAISCSYVNNISSVEKSHFAQFDVHYTKKGYNPEPLAEPECMGIEDKFSISSRSVVLVLEKSADGWGVSEVDSAALEYFNQLQSANVAATCPGYEPPKPDTIKPILTVPSDITVQATNSESAVVTFSVSATDNVDKNLSPTCYPPAGTSTFEIGITTVNCSVSDSAGNTASKSFLITVTERDTTPPVITVLDPLLEIPHDDVLPLQIDQHVNIDYSKHVSAFDDVDGKIIPTCTPPSPVKISIGYDIRITCNAKDKAGNSAIEKSFGIFVPDTIPPKTTIKLLSNWNEMSPDAKGMDVTFMATPSDNRDESQDIDLDCEETSFIDRDDNKISIKKIFNGLDGTKLYTFWAERGQAINFTCITEDLSGNRESNGKLVIIPYHVDKIPPEVTVPEDFWFKSGDGTYAFDLDLNLVHFDVSAYDKFDDEKIILECNWVGKTGKFAITSSSVIVVPKSISSGNTYLGPGGVMNITCTAKDKAENIGEASFTVNYISKSPIPETKKQKIDAIYHVQGDVEIKRASGSANEKLTKYSTLYPGDSIVTGPNETVTITFLSGDKVKIAPNSVFEHVDVTKDKTLLQLLKGKLHSIFVKKCSNVGECNVGTPKAIATVRGTEFVTTHTDGITIFDLKEGTLEITNLSNGDTKLVNAGNTITVNNFGISTKPLTDQRWNILIDEIEPQTGINDTDGDGISNLTDDCPYLAGTKINNGCPFTQSGGDDTPTWNDDGYEFQDGKFKGDTPDDDQSPEYEDEYDYDFYEYSDPENIEYGFQDPSNYNVGIDIPSHWTLFEVANDRSEFPARTYYTMWYNTWMNWIELSLFHNLGDKMDLQNYDDIIEKYEDYKRQWCEVTKTNPVFLDEPGDESGWSTCLELKDFNFKKIKIDGIDSVQVSYLMSEKFVFEGYDDDIEFETWAFWENLIPYGNDVIVVSGETLNRNVGQQRIPILDSINSFKILNYGQPVFLETSAPSVEPSKVDRLLSPTQTKTVEKPDTDIIISPSTGECCDNPISPTRLSVGIGSVIRLYNDDTVSHTILSGHPNRGADGIINTVTLEPGQMFSIKLNTARTIEYFCEQHPWEKGIIKINNYNKPINESLIPITIPEYVNPQTSEPMLSENIVETITIPENIVETPATTPIEASGSVSLKLDHREMQLKRHESIQLTVSGDVDDYTRGARILFTITDPKGETTEQTVIATKDGKYENYLWFDKSTIYGEYKITTQFRGEESKTLTFNLLPPYLETKFVEKKIIYKAPVPAWLKENVKWWADGAIGDDSFKQGISFMIKENIISIDDLPKSTGVSEDKIPDWVKNNAKWWADGVIGEDDFINGLKYMVEKGIIGIN